MAIGVSQGGHVALPVITAPQVDEAVPPQGRSRVGAVASGVHPDGAPNRTGNPHRPFEAGEGGGRRPTGQYRQLHGRAGPDPVTLAHLETGEGRTEAHDQPGKPGVGHQQVGTPTEHQHGHARVHDRRLHHRQVGVGDRLTNSAAAPPTR